MKTWWVDLLGETRESAESDCEYRNVVRALDKERAIAKAESEAWNNGLNVRKAYVLTIGEVPEGFAFD